MYGVRGYYFFLNFLRAAFSHPARLPLAFLWQAFKAALSFWARTCAAVLALGQPVTLIEMSKQNLLGHPSFSYLLPVSSSVCRGV